MSSADLVVRIGKLELKNPVCTASGTFGYGELYSDFYDPGELGAICTKGLSLEPRAGNVPPRIWETSAGMLNAIGLENIGVRAFITDKLPFLRERNVTVIANFFGSSPAEYAEAARRLSDAEGIHALEANISCPNVHGEGKYFGSDPKVAGDITRACREATPLPLIMKMTPECRDIGEIARIMEAEGADALSVINTITGMAIDIDSRTPRISFGTGGLSGPAIKPIAVRMVWEAARAVRIPIMGIGGIATADDAIEFLLAGATAVQVGTINFVAPRAPMDILEGIRDYLDTRNISAVTDIIGTVRMAEEE